MARGELTLFEIGLREGWLCHGWVHEPSFPEPLRRDVHRAFEVGVLLAGRQDRHFGGLVIPIGPGDVYLASGWEPHGWRTTAPGTRLLVVQFLPQFLGDERLDNESWLSLFARPSEDRPRADTPDTRSRALHIAHRLIEEFETHRPGWQTAVRIGLLDLLFTVGRGERRGAAPSGQRTDHLSSLQRVIPAVNLVHSRPRERVTVAQAAAACSLSPCYFSVLFRRATGFSFAKFALRFRLHCAVDALLSGDIGEDRIAFDFGFHDASHFRRAFRRMYGCAPTQYRSRYAEPVATDMPELIVPDAAQSGASDSGTAAR